MDGDTSYSSTVVGVIVVTILLSGIVVCLRSFARVFLLRVFGLDDGFMLLTLALFLVNNVLMLAAVNNGFGQPHTYLTGEQYSQVVKLEVVAQFFAVITYGPAKVSVAICLGRIFLGRKLMALLWVISILNVVGFTGMGILQLAQCTPVAKQWDPMLDGHCLNPQIYTDYCLATASMGAASDFILALIPWYYIARLQMRRREKAAIGVAMSLGIVAGAFAIIKTIYITDLSSRTDYAFDTIPLILWSAGEQCAIMVAASIPMLRPLFRFSSNSKTSSSSNPPSYIFNSQTKTVIAGKPKKNSVLRTKDSDIDDALVGPTDIDLRGIWVEQGYEVSSSTSGETRRGTG